MRALGVLSKPKDPLNVMPIFLRWQTNIRVGWKSSGCVKTQLGQLTSLHRLRHTWFRYIIEA